ncbi:MAG: methionyl-tRNA formyltransferase, partial [Pelagibacterales bacterium]|nr:methionyl-tRNA formyltransferase [Pelagibacterales bacterium]
MKIIFIGTIKFSRKVLQKLIDLNAQVVGVCTKKKSEFNSDYEDLSPLCKKNNIPFKYIDKNFLNDDCNWIRSFNP